MILGFMVIVACKDDFDELCDSNQRRITFQVDVSHLFDNVLVQQQDGFSLGSTFSLDETQRLRLTSYCYDINDSRSFHIISIFIGILT